MSLNEKVKKYLPVIIICLVIMLTLTAIFFRPVSDPGDDSSQLSSEITGISEASHITDTGLVIWAPPSGVGSNTSWDVMIRRSGTQEWHRLFVYNVKIGHQEGNDPLRASVGMEYSGPVDTSMVRFDFTGDIDVKLSYNAGMLNKADISPDSYMIKETIDHNTITFSLSQDNESPRHLIVRPNDDWESKVLHINTGTPEKTAPSPDDPDVLLIKPGDPVPLVLPDDKNTYYFAPGIHDLPKGAWAEYDIGTLTEVDSFDLITGGLKPFIVPAGIRFRIEYKADESDEYKTAYENLSNNETDIRGGNIDPVAGRYFRLILLGNVTTRRDDGYNYLNSAHLKEFRLFAVDDGTNVIHNKSVSGSMFNHSITCDENESQNSYYGHVYAGESFFVPAEGNNLYLASGSVVKGAVNADWKNGISITGRGILDCSGLTHDPASTFREGRTSALRAEFADDFLLEGITVLDAPMWGIVVNHSVRPVIRNITYFGSIVNSDGIHMSGVTEGLVEDCFIRTCDDHFVMYHYGPADAVTVKDSVFFSDGGRIVLLGMADTPGDISNVVFENNDILNVQNVWDIVKHGGAFSLWATGGNTIHDIVFRNIRIEPFREPEIASVFQLKTSDESGWGPGVIENIRFEDVNYSGTGETTAYAAGYDADHVVRGLSFLNVHFGGKVLSQDDYSFIDFMEYVYDITFSEKQ